jgi:crotonobetainyl-CoA:carnitine CoA-transferase CaiB-like acyl-CoA transferase
MTTTETESAETRRSGPLAHIKIVDATSNVLGPYATQILAELGADVIKIEAPSGDFARSIGYGADAGLSAAFYALNRGKRSVVLNLRDPAGRQALDLLIDSADVFIHNMRAEAAQKLGLDSGTILARNPGIIYCAACGYGSDGPYSRLPAYDDIIQASSGAAWLQGVPVGEPRYVVTVLADKITGLMTLYALLAALVEKEHTGRGRSIEVPMFESLVSFLLVEQMAGMTWDPPTGPPVYNRTIAPTRRPFKTKDGYISVMPYTDRHWTLLLEALDRGEMMDDPRFRETSARSKNIGEAYAVLEEALVTRTSDEWLTLCREMDIPAAPINSIADLFTDPHLNAVAMFGTREHPSQGTLRYVRLPVRYDGATLPPRSTLPILGEHTVEVLRDVGCSDEQIAELLAAGTAVDGAAPAAATPS